MGHGKTTVRKVLDEARAAGRSALTAPEAQGAVRGLWHRSAEGRRRGDAADAATLAGSIGFPVVMKIVSPQILHKTEAGGVVVGVKSAAQAQEAFATIVANARRYDASAAIEGVQVQQMLTGGQEVIIGAVTDPAFGKLVAFGLGGILVEVLKDITFRLAPATREDALSMLDGIAAAEILRGVRGAQPVDREALAAMIVSVSELVADFPEISELDLNPVFATARGRHRGGRARGAGFQAAAGALPAEPGGDRAADEPHHEAGRRGGDRRLGRERQDRQFDHEEPDQRRLSGRDLPDTSERHRDHRARRPTRASRTSPGSSTSRCSPFRPSSSPRR